MSFLAARSLMEVLVSLGTNIIILFLCVVGIFAIRALLWHIASLGDSNEPPKSFDLFFWCLVGWVLWRIWN